MKFLGRAHMRWSSSSSGGYKFAERFCSWYEAGSCCQVWPEHLLGSHHHYYLWAAAPVALRWLRGRPQGWLLVWYHDSRFTPHRLVWAEQEDSQSAWRYWLHMQKRGVHTEGCFCPLWAWQIVFISGVTCRCCCWNDKSRLSATFIQYPVTYSRRLLFHQGGVSLISELDLFLQRLVVILIISQQTLLHCHFL